MNKWLLPSLVAMLVCWSALVSASTVDFELQDLDGKTHKLSDYRGKWVVVNYWATWCPPCLEEMPELEMFHNNHKDKDAVVLGVNLEKIDKKKLRSFVERQFISYPVLRANPSVHNELGNVRAMPTSYLVTPEGEVIARQVGTLTASDLENFIRHYDKMEPK